MQTVLALIVQAHESAQPETLAATFGVDWPHLGAQIISFAIVCALLYRLAYKPVLAMLATRRERRRSGEGARRGARAGKQADRRRPGNGQAAPGTGNPARRRRRRADRGEGARSRRAGTCADDERAARRGRPS